ncbi:nuclear transport factor 2 family protein [Dyella sp. GSA-30]|uniref:nuclear transport factor 2 family protein n=1 Tax=Dyella sp. GSA-30 TaxID=2994496 RepID=UPI0024914F3A|nr:nuclear transport factor 2 family protein [Dyella sp. GSA-30]BDU22573.1 hypothetical protein DYGSA30_40300 [Dyella sp. GSA-30]
MSRKLTILSMIAMLPLALSPAMALDIPPGAAKHEVSAEDQRAIRDLLATYTRAVSTSDEAAFASILLNEQIPFFSTDGLARRDASQPPPDTRQYQDFRDAVFRSHQHLTQRFYNVRIEQDGELAAVSLDFVTLLTGTQRGSYGWKTLQLIKVGGTWKIASEFYSAYSLRPSNAAPGK